MLIKSNNEDKKDIKIFALLRISMKSKLKIFNFIVLIFLLIIGMKIPFDFGISKKNLERHRRFAETIQRPIDRINFTAGLLVRENILFSTSLFGILKRYAESLNKEIGIIKLDINFEDFEKLREKRNQALKIGVLTKTGDDEVKAKISYNKKEYPVNIRLKGDYKDHLYGEKWSFRLKVRKGKTFLGLTEFSLQHPRTRSYLNEYIFHKFLKKNNLPHLRYEFFRLVLNGKNLGTYALEEHFTKELIEYNKLREAPIVHISDDIRALERKRNIVLDGQARSAPIGMKISEIDMFNKKKGFKSPGHGQQFTLAKNLLTSFLLKDKKSSEIFDLKTNPKYLSILDIFSSTNPHTVDNIRLYFDPILARFIFIGFDSDSGIVPRERVLSIDKNPINIFDDLAFTKEYVSELELITSDQYIEKIFDDLNQSIFSSLYKLNKSYPHVRYLKKEFLRTREYIRNRLSPINPVGINYLESTKLDEDYITLILYSRNIFPLQINHIIINNQLFKPTEDIILQGEKDNNVNYKKVIFKKVISNLENQKTIPSSPRIEVNYNLYGSKVIRSSSVEPRKWFNSTDTNDKYIQKKVNYDDYYNI